MMKTIYIEKEKIHSGNLLLINTQYPLRGEPNKRLAPADIRFSHILMQRDAANVLQLILEKIAAGNSIVPVSGYRSGEEQRAIYHDSLKENGAEFTKKYVALPGCSEHQTGLAIDLGLNQERIDFLCPDFPYSGICQSFRRIAPDYGFIERYAKEKEKITGISHEPWHFRYIGWPHSKIMEVKGLSLEEYITFLKDYRETAPFLYRKKDDEIAIYYVPAREEKNPVSLPDYSVYQISGNNTDGFIVTVWRKRHEKI